MDHVTGGDVRASGMGGCLHPQPHQPPPSGFPTLLRLRRPQTISAAPICSSSRAPSSPQAPHLLGQDPELSVEGAFSLATRSFCSHKAVSSPRWAQVSVLVWAAVTESPESGRLRQQSFISHSSGGPRPRHWQVCCPVRAHFLNQLLVRAHVAEGVRELPGVSLIQTPIPSTRAPHT